jgi:hypothetical protein
VKEKVFNKLSTGKLEPIHDEKRLKLVNSDKEKGGGSKDPPPFSGNPLTSGRQPEG